MRLYKAPKKFLTKNNIYFLWFFLFWIGIVSPSASKNLSSPQLELPDVSEIQDETEVKYQVLLDQGLSAFVDQNFSRALKLFQDANRLKPNDPTAQKALESVEKKMKKTASQIDPKDLENLEKAKQYYQNQQYLLSIITLQPIFDKNKFQKDASDLSNKISKKLKDTLEKNTELSSFWFIDQGLIYYIENNYIQALSCWKKSVQINPNNQIILIAISQAENLSKNNAPHTPSDDLEVCDSIDALNYIASISTPISKAQKNIVLNSTKKTLNISSFSASNTSNNPEEIFIKNKQDVVPNSPLNLPIKTQSLKFSLQDHLEPIGPQPENKKIPIDQPPHEELTNSNLSESMNLNSNKNIKNNLNPIQSSFNLSPLKTNELPLNTSEKQNFIGSTNINNELNILNSQIEKNKKNELSLNKPPKDIHNLSSSEITNARELLEKENFQQARESVELFLKQTQDDNDHSIAIDLLKKIIYEQKKKATFHYHQGLLAYAEGNISKAFEEWNTVLKINPNHSTARQILLKAFFQKNQ